MSEKPKTLQELADVPSRIDKPLTASVVDEGQGRDVLKARYAGLFGAATELFFRVDPVGINFDSNSDEYEPEVGTVLPRLESAASVQDVKRILREEFQRWFGAAFDGESTDQLAPELWSLWQAWKWTNG